MKRQAALTVVIALAILSASTLIGTGQARACLHVPSGYPDAVKERLKLAFLFHDGKNAHLVLQTNLEATKSLPDTLAWVIPLPSLPSSYEELAVELFDELTAVALPRCKGETCPFSEPEGIRVHTEQTVGNYEVQPIEILVESAGAELNAWLSQHGFDPVPVENQRYYLGKGKVFLTVKLRRLSGAQAEIRPLHITYKADRLTLPLKFSSHSGVFDVEFFTFTPYKLKKDALAQYHLRNLPSVAIKRAQLKSEAPVLFGLIGSRRGYLTWFWGEGFNGDGRLVRDLDADPSIAIRASSR